MLLSSLCDEHQFDGLVLEASPLSHRRALFVKRLAQALHAKAGPSGKPLVLIVVTQPVRVFQGRQLGRREHVLAGGALGLIT